MPGAPKHRNQTMKMMKEPVQPESVLYRILQQIAQEIAKSLPQSRSTMDRTGLQSGGSETDGFPDKIGRTGSGRESPPSPPTDPDVAD